MKRIAVAATAGMLLVVTVPGVTAAQMDPPLAPQAIETTPSEGLVEVKEQFWSYLAITPDGRALEVYWQDGPPKCHGLDRIEVAQADAMLDVRVFTGEVPDNKGCDALLTLRVTTIEFEDPLALGGRGELDTAWSAWQDEVHKIKLAAIHDLAEALPETIRFVTRDDGREDFRFTKEGREYALQFFASPETTRDDLVDYLLEREGLTPSYPPDPQQRAAGE